MSNPTVTYEEAISRMASYLRSCNPDGPDAGRRLVKASTVLNVIFDKNAGQILTDIVTERVWNVKETTP